MGELVVDKIILPIDKCIEGMILMEPIIDEYTGLVIIGKGQVLTKKSITKLKQYNLDRQVWIKIDSESTFWKVSPYKLEQYKNCSKILQSLFEEQRELTAVDLKDVKELARVLIETYTDDYDILACSSLLRQLDKDIYNHSMNIGCLALLVGRWQGYEPKVLEQLLIAGLLHDIGMIKMDANLYHKKVEDMTTREKLAYRDHSILSYETLVECEELDEEILRGILFHHECVDGSGYPLGLRAEHLNSIAKVISMVNTYDRLKEKYNIFRTLKYLGSISIKKYDVKMLMQFCRQIVGYYIGSRVLLSTGEIGEIYYIQPQAIYKPIVKVGEEFINLYEQTQITILDVL